MGISKKRKSAEAKIEKAKVYSLKDASSLVKEVNTAKFDSSVDLHIRLGVDPKKADQAIRGTVTLPHGTGKTKKVNKIARVVSRLMIICSSGSYVLGVKRASSGDFICAAND